MVVKGEPGHWTTQRILDLIPCSLHRELFLSIDIMKLIKILFLLWIFIDLNACWVHALVLVKACNIFNNTKSTRELQLSSFQSLQKRTSKTWHILGRIGHRVLSIEKPKANLEIYIIHCLGFKIKIKTLLFLHWGRACWCTFDSCDTCSFLKSQLYIYPKPSHPQPTHAKDHFLWLPLFFHFLFFNKHIISTACLLAVGFGCRS